MSDVAATAVALTQAQTQHTAQILMLKKQHEMQQSMIDMLAQSVEAAKPPAPSGQGTVVDKSA
ncbi:putative motility protein [Pelagibacterium xiamenense]|uniref:putative motility protein n=1 Tax=Pelagibacterium xiamenense TaxID=2901140 RepID=UPI001E564A31|nr:YjfB family protein [Pelagibacterium xiamenense]MCD7061302.1 YjfB family protein [Pelagibacterium xiamenense]